jgi:hypothetical protein
LNELVSRNAAIEARYKRVDLTHFTAAVYSSGVKRSSCRIWLGAPFGNGIAYSASDLGSDGGFNEILRVEDDGYSLVLEPMMKMGYSGTTEETALTKQGAAEALWSRFIGPLQ